MSTDRSHSNHSLRFTPTSYTYWLLTVARDLTSLSLVKMSIMNAGLRCGLNVMIQTSCLEHKESMEAAGEGEASQFVIFLPVTV